MKRFMICILLIVVLMVSAAYAANVVPPVIDLPGTQPREVSSLESPDECDNCHGGYSASVKPAYSWRGSMMANAGRDPIFWATLAVAEQDFDGAGDLCIRCHSTAGWLAGHSTPTDGSGLEAGDADGVECDFCHRLTNPDGSELQGVQFQPFITSDPLTGEGFYGSGMSAVWGGNEKLGPYLDAMAMHPTLQSRFHRSVDFCGVCHDVSNSVVGHLAANFGAQDNAVAQAQVVDGGPRVHPMDQAPYVALNNPPYRYGIVERTFSEYKSGLMPVTKVADYLDLPADLQGGAVMTAVQSSFASGAFGNYADGTPRYFSCQTCHLRPVTVQGCNKNGSAMRKDLSLHDMTGGNYWMPEAIQYLDDPYTGGYLRLGGGLSATQIAALNDGALRARKQLNEAATIEVLENTNALKITNLTGHKLITGYPEGRRMWVNIKWYGISSAPLGEDGGYGSISVCDPRIQGNTDYSTCSKITVNSILDLEGSNTEIFEAHYGITKDWASTVEALHGEGFALSYDRYSGAADYTAGWLADTGNPDTAHETFHFALNNVVIKDNRIPPYGMSYDEAIKRNALPVPAGQYGDPGPGGRYEHFYLLDLVPPEGAVYAEIRLLYQPTSWEYVQFLCLANSGQNAFLADEGVNILDAWLNTGMAEPYVMAETVWSAEPLPQEKEIYVESLATLMVGRKGNETLTDTFSAGQTVTLRANVVEPLDPLPVAVEGAQVFVEVYRPGGGLEATLQGFSDASGNAEMNWKTSRRQQPGTYSATVTDVIRSGYQFDSAAGQRTVTFTIR